MSYEKKQKCISPIEEVFPQSKAHATSTPEHHAHSSPAGHYPPSAAVQHQSDYRTTSHILSYRCLTVSARNFIKRC
ncbi:hypothetical protein Pfo_027497 [Paulownia fortunei]|nr:hypothetical protein Pfo_027497 [Paulownia fortunei]